MMDVAAVATFDTQFPCSLIISVPLPTHRLASTALRALEVDAELSPLVRRSFSLTTPGESQNGVGVHSMELGITDGARGVRGGMGDGNNEELKTVLRTEYKATTNRMLRVAVNGFMESLGVVLGVMEELDVDMLSNRA